MFNEDYRVELLKKLPVYHRRIYEYQQIAKVQTPELEKLLIAIDFVLDNWFIETASEYGLSRLEKIAGITSVVGENLETRRYKLFVKMTESIPYTDKTLDEWLSSMCDRSEYCEVVRDYSHYKLTINTTLGKRGVFDEVCDGLLKMIPCNLVLEIYNTLSDYFSMGLYCGMAISVAMEYTITHDINILDNLNMNLYEGVGFSEGNVSNITHDIHTIEDLNMNLYSGLGVSNTKEVTVSHDDTFNENLINSATVAIPTTIATVITME